MWLAEHYLKVLPWDDNGNCDFCFPFQIFLCCYWVSIFLQWVRWLLCINLFPFHVNLEEGKVLQIINRKTVCSFSSHLLSVAVCQVLVQHGLRDLCPWGIALQLFVGRSQIVGYIPRRRTSCLQQGQILNLIHLLYTLWEFKICLLKNMSETVYVEIYLFLTHWVVLFCFRMIIFLMQIFSLEAFSSPPGGNLGLNAVLSLVNVSCIQSRVSVYDTSYIYTRNSSFTSICMLKIPGFNHLQISLQTWFHCS